MDNNSEILQLTLILILLIFLVLIITISVEKKSNIGILDDMKIDYNSIDPN
jgi:thioredoxin-related protein